MSGATHLHTTRAAYDAIAAEYAGHFAGELAAKPMARAILGVFAEVVRGAVIDVGCGPGRVTAYLHGLGVAVSGVDLSPEMVALARREHPGLRFEEGTMTALGAADGSLGGVVAWYSVIHTPREELPAVLAEFHRALAPGGHLLLAFQVGEEPWHLGEIFGRTIALDFYRWTPERLAGLLAGVGFAVEARLLREPDAEERTPHAHLLARKTTAGTAP
ncbi:class I SAM-dependent DNA methyltransferase [Streptomyces johnsoniae]|uniref:Class I SAM-dependent methyltransferase n=1 Tax=Streptomyces johnsoniae TaxID=3075532 RepID=A0ABU2S2J9_9ACTN|nr:class I SAM-dependent methyltransferase [Streptomyces sp. DSM 41886]MDT0441825.1 class I SAM-dependent methyltransferase [Streptomyces sp. DSM 41886]